MKTFRVISLILFLCYLFGSGASKSTANITTKNQKFTTLKVGSSKQVKGTNSQNNTSDCSDPDGNCADPGTTNAGNPDGCKDQTVCNRVYVPRVGYKNVCKVVLVCPPR